MMEPEMCVCGHGILDHRAAFTDTVAQESGRCWNRVDHVGDIAARCYCPRFIPRPPPPGTLPNEGKKVSLR